MKTSLLIAAAAVAFAPLPALAHVVVSPTAAPGGKVVDAAFKAGHGCGELKTTSIRVEIPAAIGMVHAHEVKGWSIKLEKSGDKTTAVTWTAGKDADPTSAVSAHLLLPETKGKLYFPATQTCGTTVTMWDEQPGGKAVDKHPAPSIDVGGAAAAAAGGHDEHMHDEHKH
jgi:uncharacterized protein YcnI